MAPMPNITLLPSAKVPLIYDGGNTMTTEWYRFFWNIYGFTGTGVVPVDKGGTGLDTIGNHQIIIGNVNNVFEPASFSSSSINISYPAGYVNLELGTSTVTPGTYGSASQVGVFTVNQYGILTAASNTSIAINANQIISGTLLVARGGTGASTLTGYVKGNGTSAFTASATVPTTDLSGTITNAQLANSTISGVSLGSNLFNLTAGTGISFSTGTTYNGSAAITINATGSGGGVTSVTGTAPIASSGGTTPAISISQATTSTNGYLSSTDWNTFNNKGSGTVTSVSGTGTVNGITLTGTVTSSGSLTLGGTLSGIGNSQLTNSTISGVALGGNLFNLTAGTGVSFSAGTTYNGSAAITINATGSGGTVTSVALTAPSLFTVTGSPITSSGTLALTYSGTALPILNGGTGQTTASAAFNALSPITTTGDLIIGNGTNSATRLPIGANSYVLTSNGTTATWAAIPSGGVTQIIAGTGITISPTGGTGNVTISNNAGVYAANFLIIAGGGAGGDTREFVYGSSAGGGAGGFVFGTTAIYTGVVWPVIVGAGGAVVSGGQGFQGGNSSVFGVTAIGGGFGGATATSGASGGSGGSGGGGPQVNGVGGSGTAGQGNAGGNGSYNAPSYGSGGGGGAGAVGGNGSPTVGGNGGNGLTSTITGSSVYYAGGGGGGGYQASSYSSGGLGGGGAGGGPGTAGTANTGGGGGGSGYAGGVGQAGGAGGSGVVILSIPTVFYTGVTTGSPTVTTNGIYTVLTFTSSGSYTA
jgi:hypothetical protein